MFSTSRDLMRAAACFTTALALLAGGTARAADFQFRTTLDADSRARGMGRADLPLLRRGAGAGAGRTVEVLSKKFSASTGPVSMAGQPRMDVEKDRTVATWGDGRSLIVFGDGSTVSFRNAAVLNASTPVAKDQQLSADRLAQIGRQFIQRELADLVRLGANEKLEPFSTRVQVGGGADVNSLAPPVEHVLLSQVVFTRTVDGVPVLGSGSKVALMITNEGQVAGFDFDWAEYQQTGRRVKMLAAAQVQERVKQLGTVKLDSPEVSVKRYECGLFDAGQRHRDPRSPLQGACVVHAVQRKIVDAELHARDPKSGHEMSAVIDVIPAGETVEADDRWPQAQRLLGKPMGGSDRVAPPGPGPRP